MLYPEIRRAHLGDASVNGELKTTIRDLHNGDHRNAGITCRDGYLYFALGRPSNEGFADPDNLGWTDIPDDPLLGQASRRSGHDAARCTAPELLRPTLNGFEAVEENGRVADLQRQLEDVFKAQNKSGRKDITSISATFLWVTVAL